MKKKFIISLCFGAMALVATPALAQNRAPIQGTVVDENGDPIIGASVRIEGQKDGAVITDLDGKPVTTKVGGNFTYVGLTDAWTFNEMTKLREIGGNLTIMNCDIHGLWGFDKLTRIGGNVTISHNTDIALEGTNSGGAAGNPGFCRIRYYMDAGIISPDAAVTLGDAGGSVIDPEILTACAPGN